MTRAASLQLAQRFAADLKANGGSRERWARVTRHGCATLGRVLAILRGADPATEPRHGRILCGACKAYPHPVTR